MFDGAVPAGLVDESGLRRASPTAKMRCFDVSPKISSPHFHHCSCAPLSNLSTRETLMPCPEEPRPLAPYSIMAHVLCMSHEDARVAYIIFSWFTCQQSCGPPSTVIA